MASGSFDLTTYYAKRIMGDNNASTAATALLQSGVNSSMWIFGHARGNYGIKYLKANSGTADKIEFHGGATDTTTAWIELDDGTASFGATTLSSASITNDATVGGTLGVTGATSLSSLSTSGNATIGGTLGVTGATTLSGNTTHGGHVYLTGTTSTGANNTTQIVFTNSGATTEYLALTANTSGSFIINPSSSSSTGQVVFVPSGNSYLKSGTLTVNASGQGDYTFKVSGTANITGVTTLSSTTAIDTSNYTTGALVVSGGASFNKDIIVNGWLRTGGEKGWYNQTYAGGLYMRDSSYVRMYGNKQFVISSSHSTSENNLSSQLIVSSVAYNSAIDTTAGTAVAIELWRGSNASWQIVNDTGTLHFKNNWTTAKQSTYTQDSITIAYNTGNTTIAGTLTTGGSIYAGSADSTAERSVVARSNAGSISIYSTGNNDSNGARGLYFSAHGTGAAVIAVHCDTNNNITLRLMESTNNKYVAVKADANTDNRTWTIPVTAGNRYFMGTTASSYTANQMFYAPQATYVAQTPNLYYIPEADAELGTTKGKKVGILLVGTAYGNTAANLGSNTVNVFRFGDPGPQIRFSTATNGAEMGAIIWSSHSTSNNLDQAFYFVGRTDTNNTEANVGIVTKTIVARTRLTIGQNYCNTGWALYVSGGICSTSTQYIKNTTMDLTTANNGSSNTLYTAYEGCDKNGNNYFSVEGYSSSDGSTTTGLYLRNFATDGTDQGWSALTITKTKTNVVTTSIPGTVTIINTTNATYSDSSSPALLVNGGARIKKNLFAGLSTDTEERQVGVVSKAGKIYFYSEGSTTGNRGIYGYNAAGTGANILTLNQNSRITGLVGIKTDFTFYQGDTVIRGGTAPSSNAYRAFVFRSADVNNEQKMLAQIANIYRTSGENELELVVVAPRSDATNTYNGLRIYSGTTTSNNTTTDYAYGTFSAPLAVNTTTGNRNYALYANGDIYSKSLTLSGTTTNGMDAGSSNPNIKFVENDSTQPVYIIYTDQDSYRAPAGLKVIGGTSATPAWFEVEGSIYAGSSTHTAERDIYAVSNSGNVALYSTGNSNSNGNRGLWFGAHGNGSSLTAVLCDTNTNVTLCARTAGSGITIAARSTPWPNIRFDTTASESGAAYTTVTQTTQGMIYCQVPAKKESDSTYYRTRFFFRQYSTTNNTTTRLDGFEDYYLPTTNAGLTTSKAYDILTTKDLSFSITGTSSSVSYQHASIDFSQTNNALSSNWEKNMCWFGDKNGVGTGRINFIAKTDGTNQISMQARRWNTSGSAVGVFAGITIVSNRSNATTCTIDGATTVSGTITAYNSNIFSKHGTIDITSSSNNLSSNSGSGFYGLDKNGKDYTRCLSYALTDGETRLYLQARNYTSSAYTTYGGIIIKANKSNSNINYEVTTPANFRTAIGVGASGTHEDSYFALASHTHTYLWQRTSLTKGTNPSSTSYMLGSWAMETGSGTAIANRLHGFEGYVDTNGRSGIRFITYQYTSGGTAVNQLGCYIDKNGTRGYTITDTAAFRTALSLGTAATTDSTAYISSTMSSNTSNKFAGCNANFRKYGNMVFLTIQGENATALAAGTSAFTIPSGYRPAEAHWYPMVRAGSLAMLGIYTDGKIVCNVAITAGNTIRADAVYIASS